MQLTIGITGAGGFIGSHLAYSLENDNIRTILITGPEQNVVPLKEANIIDISDCKRLKKILKGADVIVHLAGLNSVGDSFINPIKSLQVNTIGTTSLLNVCNDLAIKRVIIISSAEVYGKPMFNPVSEDASLTPLSPYGVSKVAIENISYVYHLAYGINFKILRPFSIYGPSMSNSSLISEIYRMASTMENISLFNTTSIRDYCYVEDLITAIRKVIADEFKGFEIFNIGSGIGTSSRQLARLISSILHTSGEIIPKHSSDRPKESDINHLVANTSKANYELNWKAETALIDGLNLTIKSFQNE